MKKIFSISLAFVAMALIAFTSCEDDDPRVVVANVLKAEFSVTANPEDDTKIALINKSEHAISYHWSFGDGTISTEENPTHTYTRPEKEADYTIELTVKGERGNTSYYKQLHTVLGVKDLEGDGGDNEKPSADFEITLDGNFDDWNTVPAANLAMAELDEENSTLHRLKTIKLCANAEYIYMYLKMDKANANAMDVYLNADGKKTTGYNSWMWKDLGANYLMQASYEDNYDFNLFPYNEEAGGGWGWLAEIVVPGQGLFEKSEFIPVEGTIVEFEGRFKRSMIPNLGKEIRIAIGHSGAAGDLWSTSGGLPTVLNGDKNEPLLVKLP